MTIRFRFLPLSIAVLAAAVAVPATAVELELTPWVGYRDGDYHQSEQLFGIPENPPPGEARQDSESSPAYGLVAGFGVGGGWQIEVLASRQETELRLDTGSLVFVRAPGEPDFEVTHLQVGLAYTWGEGPLRPFAAAAAGASRVEIEPVLFPGVDEDAFSVSAGGGVKVPLGARFGLRLEGRGYWVDLPRSAGDDFVQSEAVAGATFHW